MTRHISHAPYPPHATQAPHRLILLWLCVVFCKQRLIILDHICHTFDTYMTYPTRDICDTFIQGYSLLPHLDFIDVFWPKENAQFCCITWISLISLIFLQIFLCRGHAATWVMSHTWMSYVTHTNESCHTHEWVTSHIWMSHVTHKLVMSHTWMSYITHMNDLCHTYEWVISHTWMSYVAHMNESCYTHEWVMSHTWMSYVAHINESCHT